jgi:hypothetical protein
MESVVSRLWFPHYNGQRTHSMYLKKISSPLFDVPSKNSTKPQKNETVDLATLYVVEGDYEGRFQKGQDGRLGLWAEYLSLKHVYEILK